MGNPKFPNQGAGDPQLTPASPTYGLLQADFVYQEDVDSGHPLNLDYFIPINCQTVKTARLSFRLRLYRTYSTFTLTTTSGQSANHTHGMAHTHTHNHTLQPQNIAGAGTVAWNNSSPGILAVTNLVPNGDTTSIQNDSTGSSAANTGVASNDHTHNVNVNSTLGVAEDVNNNPSYHVLFDGVDHTADIIPAGPYTTDQVELDVTKFISTKVDRAWHVITLSPNARGRIQAVMRLLYNSNLV